MTETLLLVYAVACAIRLVVCQRAGSIYPDGAVELELAQSLLDGRWGDALELRFPPLFASLCAVLSRVSGLGLESAAEVLTVLGSACVAPACALAAAELAPTRRARVAFAAGLLAALQPWLARLGGQVMAYGLSHAALAGALWLTLRAARRQSSLAAAGAGALVGLGYLGRADALATGAGLAAALAWGRGPWRRLPRLAAFGLACVLLMSPYLVAIRAHSGAWRLSLKKEVGTLVSPSLDPGPPRVGSPSEDVHLLIRSEERPGDPSAFVVGPWSFPLVESARFAAQRISVAANPLLLILACAGLCLPHAARTRWIAPWALLAFTAAQTLLKATHGYTHTPHCAAAAVLVVPQAGWALTRAADWLATRRGWSSRVCAATLLCLCLLALLPKALKPQLHHRRAEPRLGRFLRLAWGPRPLVISGRGSRVIAHYAGARYLVLPHAPLPQALARARAAGADLLVVQVRSVDERPRLLEAELERLGLRPLRHGYRDQDPVRSRSYEWLVYPLEGPASPQLVESRRD